MDYLPELFQIRKENVKKFKISIHRETKFIQVTKTFPLRFQNLFKTPLGLFVTFGELSFLI